MGATTHEKFKILLCRVKIQGLTLIGDNLIKGIII
jgi:hypothetical protein